MTGARLVRRILIYAILVVAVGSVNGYVLSKWKFRGADIIFLLILFGMFIPYQSILIPLVSLLQVWTRAVAGPWIQSILAWPVPRWLGWFSPFLANYIPAYGTTVGLVLIHVIYGIPITTLVFRNSFTAIPRNWSRRRRDSTQVPYLSPRRRNDAHQRPNDEYQRPGHVFAFDLVNPLRDYRHFAPELHWDRHRDGGHRH
jgi:hypothetical protein